jgi:hypothetical protein
MPKAVVDLLGQRNALLFYSQRLQAALQTQKRMMQYASDSFDTRTLQLAEALDISPEAANQQWMGKVHDLR